MLCCDLKCQHNLQVLTTAHKKIPASNLYLWEPLQNPDLSIETHNWRIPQGRQKAHREQIGRTACYTCRRFTPKSGVSLPGVRLDSILSHLLASPLAKTGVRWIIYNVWCKGAQWQQSGQFPFRAYHSSKLDIYTGNPRRAHRFSKNNVANTTSGVSQFCRSPNRTSMHLSHRNRINAVMLHWRWWKHLLHSTHL